MGNQEDAIQAAIRLAKLPAKPYIISDDRKSLSSFLHARVTTNLSRERAQPLESLWDAVVRDQRGVSMASVIIPVLLCFFLGPGVGQLYNKEYKKGALLIGVSFVILLVAGVWYFNALKPFLPADLSRMPIRQAAQEIVRDACRSGERRQKGYVLSISLKRC